MTFGSIYNLSDTKGSNGKDHGDRIWALKILMQAYPKTAYGAAMAPAVPSNSELILCDICPREYGFLWMCQVFRNEFCMHLFGKVDFQVIDTGY